VTGKDIPPDEPLFLLRGQDEFAPRAIEAYADELEIAAAKHAEVLEDEKELTLLEQAVQVRAHALAMRRWQLENPGRTKRPD
jgi:hypothetical protein